MIYGFHWLIRKYKDAGMPLVSSQTFLLHMNELGATRQDIAVSGAYELFKYYNLVKNIATPYMKDGFMQSAVFFEVFKLFLKTYKITHEMGTVIFRALDNVTLIRRERGKDGVFLDTVIKFGQPDKMTIMKANSKFYKGS